MTEVKEIPFIDIHTHNKVKAEGITVFNILNENNAVADEENLYYSLGIHPWYIDDMTVETHYEFINKYIDNEKVIAIGECGLDRLVKPPYEIQKEILVYQLQLAEKMNKPLIIHCVRAYEELIEIKNELKVKQPMIIHGFNSSPHVSDMLIKAGFYLSFGKALLKDGSNAAKIITKFPIGRIFLETDDSNRSIIKVYERAASLLKIEVEELKTIIFNNFNKVFVK